MARYVLAEPIDAAKIVNCHGHGEHHWLLVLSDGRCPMVSHDWVRRSQPVAIGQYFVFSDNRLDIPGFCIPERVFESLFGLQLRKTG